MKFAELEISDKTIKGLTDSNYESLTEIQQQAIPIALEGADLLAKAKTGSGKTLSFLIPMLELLVKNNWGPLDGLGALVITPTRELALQIFNVLRKIGKHHSFSAGLIIGGKDIDSEKERVGRMNILICTPGRLLQHMDQSPSFDVSNLLALILDEADCILDAGFQRELDAIIEHLPKERQTLLYSATMTSKVDHLARLSLMDPKKVSIDDVVTPQNLIQKYVVTTLDMKLSLLFSFITTHLKCKMIMFLSSCKQVRFVYETFCKMQPGIPLLHLHGKQKQMARAGIYTQFCKKSAACLFATDIAARGLDFPAVSFVISVDCPENVDTYIHRVGRTARYNLKGQSLLFLDKSEIAIVKLLKDRNIPIDEAKVNPSKTKIITPQIASLIAASPDLKYLAQKTFITYLKSIHLHSNKDIFDVSKLPFENFAASLGLPGAPKVKILGKTKKNINYQQSLLDNSVIPRLETSNEVDEYERVAETTAEKKKKKTKIEKMFTKKNNNVLSEHFQSMVDKEPSDEEDILQLSRKDHEIDVELDAVSLSANKKIKKKKLAKLVKGERVVFDDEGNTMNPYALESLDEFKKNDLEVLKQNHVNSKSEALKIADIEDKKIQKLKRKRMKDEKKFKEKAARRLESGGPRGALGGYVEGDGDYLSPGEEYVSDGEKYEGSSNKEDSNGNLEEAFALDLLNG